MTFVRAISGVLLASVTAAALSAQAPASQIPPTFRSGVDLIEVDVIVTDREGNTVRDLTRDDFEIVEDGRAQTVRTFSLIDLPAPSRVPAIRSGGGDIVPDTATNERTEGRTYVLLLDSPSTMGSHLGSTLVLKVKQIARQFLSEAVRPGDDVAVVHVQGSTADGHGHPHQCWGRIRRKGSGRARHVRTRRRERARRIPGGLRSVSRASRSLCTDPRSAIVTDGHPNGQAPDPVYGRIVATDRVLRMRKLNRG